MERATITFDSNDHPESVTAAGALPMLCTPTISNVSVTNTHISGTASLNVLSIETFERLQVPYDQLMPTRPFSGVTDGSAVPLGQVRPLVTFGKRDNDRTDLTDFDVACIGLPYNAILGYPALAKFMAATQPGYNVIKMPGSGGVITVAGDKGDADRAKTKKVFVDNDNTGPTFTIGAGLPSGQEKALIRFLRANKDVFAWKASDLVGVPRKVIEHHLAVCPNAHPVKQKARRQTQEKQEFIVQEVRKLHDAGVIREVRHPESLVNPVVVPKKGGQERINTGATFQRLTHIVLGSHLGRNAEAYVNDIVVKSREETILIEDLEEMFANLHKVNLRLNPEKCVFGVPPGKLLDFLVSHQGIEANPEKGHPIKVVSTYPLERVRRSPNAAGRVVEWNIELQAFQLEVSMTMLIKGAPLTDFVAEWTDTCDQEL
ncbi:uncharacterized protein [Aegilops tauschii subsp. strangulata]|uniref:uncharacterized protein n=1 Tax=Aegilops tauschii subsp. strangulata TaxID=200361 RepID=UPI003CC8DD84